MTDETQQNDEWLELEDENAMRAAIFESKDREEVLVPVPEWRMKVLIRAMSGTQKAIYESDAAKAQSADEEYLKRLYFNAVQMCCIHPKTRKPVFKLADRDTFMNERNGAVIDMLAKVALRISKLDTASREAAQKNFEAILVSSATTNSQCSVAALLQTC